MVMVESRRVGLPALLDQQDEVQGMIRKIVWAFYLFIEGAILERCLPLPYIIWIRAKGHAEYGSRLIVRQYRCGHRERIREMGDDQVIQSKIDFFRTRLCPRCLQGEKGRGWRQG